MTHDGQLAESIETLEQEVARLTELKTKWAAIAGRELALAVTKLEEAVHRLHDARRIIDE